MEEGRREVEEGKGAGGRGRGKGGKRERREERGGKTISGLCDCVRSPALRTEPELVGFEPRCSKPNHNGCPGHCPP